MRFPRTVDLAIHSLWYMAYCPEDGPVMVKELAQSQNVSESYLAKLFQMLAKTDIVTSTRGKNGGYILNKTPETITIGDIVRAVEGEENIFDCAFEPRGCGGRYDCGLAVLFGTAMERMFEVLDAVTLADLKHFSHDKAALSRPWLEFRYQGPDNGSCSKHGLPKTSETATAPAHPER